MVESIRLIYERNLILFNSSLFMAVYVRMNRIITSIDRYIRPNSKLCAHLWKKKEISSDMTFSEFGFLRPYITGATDVLF